MPGLHPPRVLVVADDPAVRALVVRALEEAGYETVAVPDGETGLNAAKTAGVSYDLVITSSFILDMTGEQLLGYLRDLFPYLPLLHLHSIKPFSVTALLESVALAVAERTATSTDS